jgi:hypothetical protein
LKGADDHSALSTDTKQCECGCEQPAPIAQKTSTISGTRAGQQLRYVLGHNLPSRPRRVTGDETGEATR